MTYKCAVLVEPFRLKKTYFKMTLEKGPESSLKGWWEGSRLVYGDGSG